MFTIIKSTVELPGRAIKNAFVVAVKRGEKSLSRVGIIA